MLFKTMTATIIAVFIGAVLMVFLGSFWWAILVIVIVGLIERIVVKDDGY